MTAFLGFLDSKRALLCLALLIAATVLAALGIMTLKEWIDYTQYIVTVWVAGETVTNAVQAISARKSGSAS